MHSDNDETINAQPDRTTRSGRISKRHVWTGFEGKETYNFATTSNLTIHGNTVIGYLCAQTAYIKSLKIYLERSRAGQRAIEDLVLTQIGMRQGIKLMGGARH